MRELLRCKARAAMKRKGYTRLNKPQFDPMTGGLVPITFTEHYIDEKLMSPKRGAPVLARLNRFTGWTASFEIACVETAYSLESVTNIINLAGFGLGIGSGRSSGYGRYHVVDVK